MQAGTGHEARHQVTSAITRSARDEECQIRIPLVCNRMNETVVFCHANGSAAGKGLWQKSPDYLGAYGCSSCHDVVDYRVKAPAHFTRDDIRLMFAEGIFRTQRILEEKGLLKVAA